MSMQADLAAKEKRKGAPPSKKGSERNLSSIVPFLGIVIVIVFFQIVSEGKMLSLRNANALINEAFALAIGSVGVLFVMAQSNIDLSMGALVGLAGTVAAKAGIIDAWMVLPIAILVGLGCGFVSGILVAKIKITPFIATLGWGFMCRGLVTALLDGGAQGIDASLYMFDETSFKMPFLIIFLVIMFILFEYSKFGKQSRAIGAKTEVARQAGVNVDKMKIIAYCISGLACGLVGFFSIVRAGAAATTTGHNFEFDVLLALMLGGLPITGGWNSKFRNAVFGAFTMTIIANGLTIWGLDVFVQQLVRGIIFIVVVSLSFDRKNIKVIK